MNNYLLKFRLFELGFLIITTPIILLILSVTTTCVTGESSKCLMVYKEGGAPAVFKSPKCPRWTLPDYTSKSRSQSPVATCQTAVHQGRRKYQEDRVLCNLDVRIPFPGRQSHYYTTCFFGFFGWWVCLREFRYLAFTPSTYL